MLHYMQYIPGQHKAGVCEESRLKESALRRLFPQCNPHFTGLSCKRENIFDILDNCSSCYCSSCCCSSGTV